MQQTNPTNEAHAQLEAAQTEHATLEARESDARKALERAMSAVQNEGTPAAGKALLAAEDAVRLAAISKGGAAARLKQARAKVQAAEHADRVVAARTRMARVGFMSFSAAATPLARNLAELRARAAEAEAEAVALCRGFTQEAKSIADEGKALGVAGVRAIDYSRVFESLSARARGDGAATILAEVWLVQRPIPGVSAEDALAAVERGVNPLEVVRVLADLERAVALQKSAAVELTTRGHIPKPPQSDSASALMRFTGFSGACNEARATLQAMGFGTAAGTVREDALAVRLLAVPSAGTLSGAQRVGDLIAQLRAAAVAEVLPNARNAAETAAARARLAETIASELEALGFQAEARALMPASGPSPAAPPASSAGFVNLNVGA